MTTCIELFAGGGGLALGGEMAGLEHTLLVEQDKYCVQTLRQNRPQWNIIPDDITTTDLTMYTADVLTGGFPCQSFSDIGTKRGLQDTRGTLFYEYARAVDDIRPKIFIAENVRGILSCDNGRALDTILTTLEDLQYNVQYKLLNAWDYNVAQKRQRVFIVGTQEGYKYKYPKPHEYKPVLRDVLENVPPSKGSQYNPTKKEVLTHVPQGGCYKDLDEDNQKILLGAMYGHGPHSTSVGRRIAWDEPCLTLMTRPSAPRSDRIHPEETRPFTVREYARIQSFPDTWQFCGSMTQQYKQIGNAVPPQLAKAVLEKAVDTIKKGG